MQLLQKFYDHDDAKNWLTENGFYTWAESRQLNIFHNPTNFAFVRLRFTSEGWLIEEPTKKTIHEKEIVQLVLRNL